MGRKAGELEIGGNHQTVCFFLLAGPFSKSDKSWNLGREKSLKIQIRALETSSNGYWATMVQKELAPKEQNKTNKLCKKLFLKICLF